MNGSSMMFFEDVIVPLLIAVVAAAALGSGAGLSLPVTATIAIGFWISIVGVLAWSHRPK